MAIEALVRERYELPAFRELDRLVRHVRALVNRRLYDSVVGRLNAGQLAGLERLLDVPAGETRSALHRLKQPAKRPTVRHLEVLTSELALLDGLGVPDGFLVDVPAAKIAHFAAEAWALDAAELRRFAPPRRATVLLCLLARQRSRSRDDLVEMFSKVMAKVFHRAREQLEALREGYRSTTESLVAT